MFKTMPCERCARRTPVSHIETLTRQVARQTHWSPAEYETIEVCGACASTLRATAERIEAGPSD